MWVTTVTTKLESRPIRLFFKGKFKVNDEKYEPHPTFIEIAQSLAKKISTYVAQPIEIVDLNRMKGKRVSKNNNLDFTYFTDDAVELILNSSQDHKAQANLIAGNFNREMKRIEAAWTTITGQLDALEKNYSEALGEIRALKFCVETTLRLYNKNDNLKYE